MSVQGKNTAAKLPLVYRHDHQKIIPLTGLIEEVVYDIFDNSIGDDLIPVLHENLIAYYEDLCVDDIPPSVEAMVDCVFSALKDQNEEVNDLSTYIQQCEIVEKRLQAQNISLIPYTGDLPFRILHLSLSRKIHYHQEFLTRLRKVASGIDAILSVYEGKQASSK